MPVESKVLYRIEPFYFYDDYEKIQTPAGFRTYQIKSHKQTYYHFIHQLFFSENQAEKAIAKTYISDWNQMSKIIFANRLDENAITSFPDKKFIYRYLVNFEEAGGEKKKRCIYFKIKNVQVIATMSHVGMVVYEFSIDRITEFQGNGKEVEIGVIPQDYEWAVYALRSIHQVSKNALMLQMENKEYIEARKAYFQAGNLDLPEPEGEKYLFKPFDWCDLTNAVVSQFFEQAQGFAVKNEPGNYALMYTGAIISHPDRYNKVDLANHLFKISRGYKQTYYKRVDESGVIKPFDNVWWYFSDEGASCFVLEVDDQAAMDFFNQHYTSKWATNFYYMYLLALIQKFSFMYYTIKTNELLEHSILFRDEKYSIGEIEEELSETRKLYNRILKFHMLASHDHVSQLTHYNELYTQLRESLRIPQFMDELKEKLDTFSQVIESIATEKIAHEKEKQNSVIQTITYILLPATLTTGIMGMNIPFIVDSKNILTLPIFLAVVVLTIAMSLVINKIKINRWVTIILLAILLILFVLSTFHTIEIYQT